MLVLCMQTTQGVSDMALKDNEDAYGTMGYN